MKYTLVQTGDDYYHIKACNQASASNYTGYRSIDYVQKIYKDSEGERKAYYKHATLGTSELSCYYCLVNRANYGESTDTSEWNKKYYNALARERYVNI